MRTVQVWVVIAAAATFGTASCGSVASTFFDLPEKPKPVTGQTRQQAGVESARAVVAADTGERPPIEATLNPDSVLALLPKDSTGDVDWVAAIRKGVIRPRRALPGVEPPQLLTGFQFDFLIQGPDPTFDASFPHSAHVEWLACGSCHPRIFPYRNSTITMDAVNQGEACGWCHGKVAFSVGNCYRCHTAMPASGQADPKLVADVVLTRRGDSTAAGGDGFPRARFAHWVHRIRYRCMTCHPGVFAARAGADTLTMDQMTRGQACGACHDGRTAFGLFECKRCHQSAPVSKDSVP